MTTRYKTLDVECDGAVAVITLNRPDRLNAYTVQMGEDLVAAFRSVGDDPQVNVVVLTGAGRAFCAGVDLDELRGGNDCSGDLPRLGEEHFITGFATELFAFPKPVVAAINGAAVGVGITMALLCDIRIAAAGAKLAIPFARLGIVPGLGSTFTLPRLVGSGQAKLLAFTGRTIVAEQAGEIGLVDRVVAGDDLRTEALAIAEQIAENPPEVVGLIKEALNFGAAAPSLGDAVRFEQRQNDRRRKPPG